MVIEKVMGTWSPRVGCNPDSRASVLHAIPSWYVVAGGPQAGGDTPKVVGHYIKCVSLLFVSHLLSEPLSRTGKIPSFLQMTHVTGVSLCLDVCMLGVLLGGPPGRDPITFQPSPLGSEPPSLWSKGRDRAWGSSVPSAGRGLVARPSGLEMQEAPSQNPTSDRRAVAPGVTSREGLEWLL